MRWEGEMIVPGQQDDVFARFQNIERMAQYMPGATIDGRDDEGSYLGSITVTFGPKKLVFRGKMTSESDAALRKGVLRGQGSSDQRAARFKVEITYGLHDVTEDPAAPRTCVKLLSVAELQGVLADFARTGGPVVAKVILDEFAARFAADMAADMESARPAETLVETLSPKPLSAFDLLLRATLHSLRALQPFRRR